MAITRESSSIFREPEALASLRVRPTLSRQACGLPTWRRRAEAVATYASLAMLAFALLCCWLALMEANAWI